jgi:hypothetical protein
MRFRPPRCVRDRLAASWAGAERQEGIACVLYSQDLSQQQSHWLPPRNQEALRIPSFMSVFAPGPPAMTKLAPIAPSILGNNASRAHVVQAATARKIDFGMGLADSRRRKARAVGAIVSSVFRPARRLRARMSPPPHRHHAADALPPARRTVERVSNG